MRKRNLAVAALTGVMMLSNMMPVFAAEIPAGAIPEGQKAIQVEGTTGTGTSDTMFDVDNDILDEGKDPDVLGGDLIVSVPAELRLAYTSGGSTLTKEDKVYAVGRVKVSQNLDVKTPTNINYVADDAVTDEQKAEATVPGVVAFGTTDGDNQKENWTAQELLKGVGKTSVTEGTDKAISSTVQKSDIKYIGSYTSVIDYNINLK